MESLPTLSAIDLLVVLLPSAGLLIVMHYWCGLAGQGMYANARMLAQLLGVGYVLTFLFETQYPAVVVGVVSVMLLVAAWIALRPLSPRTLSHYIKALIAIAAGGGLMLVFITQVILDLPQWFEPRFVIPLAGMILSNAMNTVSIAGERYAAELQGAQAQAANGAPTSADLTKARNAAFNAALIPQINMLFAVGIVALPGMMTGQILAGVEPLVAVRYQIMVMSMLFASGGLAVACYLVLVRPQGDEAMTDANQGARG
jgi:putative ABC transport system permease protein